MADYEWDPRKAATNRAKHGVSFADAVAVFIDEQALTIQDEFHDEETRFLTIGMDAFNRVLVVIYTYREETVRIISARRATPREQLQYEEPNQ